VELLPIYGDLSIFANWRPSAIVDSPDTDCMDQLQKILGGLYRCAKFGCNRCSSFNNVKFFFTVFAFGLKMAINASNVPGHSLRYSFKAGE